MRRLIVTTSASLDGVIDRRGASVEAWRPPFSDRDFERLATDQLDRCDALLLGRETYQRFAASWPSATDGCWFADRVRRVPKYVASTTLAEPLAWNASLLPGSVPAAVADLKRASGGDVLMYGCGRLAAILTRHGLVDQIQVLVHPVVAGAGARLFHETAGLTAFQLTGTDTLGSGVVVLTYRPRSRDAV